MPRSFLVIPHWGAGEIRAVWLDTLAEPNPIAQLVHVRSHEVAMEQLMSDYLKELEVLLLDFDDMPRVVKLRSMIIVLNRGRQADLLFA